MLLESLGRSASVVGSGTEEGCRRQRVHWRLDLDASGAPVSGVVRMGSDSQGVELVIPYSGRTSGTTPLPLDKGEYTLGVPARERGGKRAADRHRSWVDLLDQASRAVPDPELGALASFGRMSPKLELPKDFDPTQFIAVYVSGQLPTDKPALRRWWRDRLVGAVAGSGMGQCGVCGHTVEIPEVLPVKIRGLRRIGGQAEMSLVSANRNSFEHHGLKATSRVCRSCGEATHQRLNSLLDSEQHRRFQHEVVLVWWATEETSDLMTALFEGTRPEDVAHLLSGPWRGRASPVGDPERFDAVVLGTSVARVVVRCWVSDTLSQLAGNLESWFSDAAVIDPTSGDLRVPGIGLLAQSLRPPGARAGAAPDLDTALFSCALQDIPLRDSVALAALRRVGAQGQITYPRASLLRCWIVRKRGEMPEALDPANPDPAYRAGRLLALLDEAAHAATTTNLIDRFYAQLSAHPGLVVGRLIDLHQHHIAKLRRDRPPQAKRLQRDIEEVLAPVEAFPAHLDLEGRARFALGLYHEQASQRARRAAQARSGSEATHTEEEALT
jgi:CRISPR-associated protein Csd1